MNSIKDESIVIQLATVHSMLPKVKDLIDEQIEKIADLETTIKFLQEECAALRSQLNEFL